MSIALLDRIVAAAPQVALLFDVDGTLAPIVPDRRDARVPEETRATLRALRDAYGLVACVSGRMGVEAARIVGVPGLRVVGEHGLELDPAAEAWRGRIADFADRAGLPVEAKRFTLSFHFRDAADPEAAAAALAPVAAAATAEGLVARWGRKVLEIRPPLAADKGTAVRALLAEARLERALYAGDDDTDLDAFQALGGLVLGVRVAVGSAEAPPGLRGAADLVVDGPEALLELLRRLVPPGSGPAPTTR